MYANTGGAYDQPARKQKENVIFVKKSTFSKKHWEVFFLSPTSKIYCFN